MQRQARDWRICRAAAFVFTVVLAGVPSNLHAQSCTANVENIEKKLVGNKFFTQWRITHDGGQRTLKRVYFEYHIHYANKRGATLVENGVFSELLEGAGKQYTKENISTLDPTEIISVDFNKISCSPAP
jgi:hypothetical protein